MSTRQLKRLLVLGIVITLVFFILIACSKDTPDPVAEEDNSATGSSEHPSESVNLQKEGFPIVDKPITLKVIYNSSPLTDDLNELNMFQELEDLTNIKLDVEQIRSGWEDKKSLLLASQDLPDVFMGPCFTDADILNNETFFVNMRPYIEDYCVNIMKMFTQEPLLEKIQTVPETNAIYALPNARPLRPKSHDTWFVNKQWLDTLGLKMPETLDDFYNVLTEFKIKDANGNGDPNDEVPFNFQPSGTLFTWRGILNAFGVTNDEMGDNMQVRDGKVQFIPVQEGYKKAIIYMHKLYSEGLIYSECFTQNNIRDMSRTNDISILGVGALWQKENLVGQWADQYCVLPPMKGPDGHRGVTDSAGKSRYSKNVLCITTDNPYLDATMRWVDTLYSEDMSAQLYFGSFGEAITKNEDGGYILHNPDPELDTTPADWKWKIGLADNGPTYWSKEMEAKTKFPDEYLAVMKYEDIKNPFYEPVENTFPMVMWTKEESSELAIIKNDIYPFTETKAHEWITKGGVENEWDDYIKQINAMGYDRLMEIYQKAYERFVKE